MGLFGRKKEKLPEGIRVQYYDGGLPGFACHDACQLLLAEDILRITKTDPYVEVTLERSRITSMEYHPERNYMLRYKGHDGTFSTSGKTSFYVINYISKKGIMKHLDFWTVGFEDLKMVKMMRQLQKNQPEQNYEI